MSGETGETWIREEGSEQNRSQNPKGQRECQRKEKEGKGGMIVLFSQSTWTM